MPIPASNRTKFLAQMRKHEANASISPSAVRGQVEHTRERVLKFLPQIDLRKAPRDEAEFKKWLEGQTERLRCNLPGRTKPWGVARKCLNLYLRSCFYNHYLREEYGLGRIEKWLEIPLDSMVMKALMKYDRSHKGGWSLPKERPNLKRKLKLETSEQFQLCAEKHARDFGLRARVHLDIFLGPDNR